VCSGSRWSRWITAWLGPVGTGPGGRTTKGSCRVVVMRGPPSCWLPADRQGLPGVLPRGSGGVVPEAAAPFTRTPPRPVDQGAVPRDVVEVAVPRSLLVTDDLADGPHLLLRISVRCVSRPTPL
jgi:hypothetical protein